jgi:hypothetical protein
MVLQAFEELGGEATVREVANHLCMSTNGISQTIGAMKEHLVLVERGRRSGGDDKYRLPPTEKSGLL